MKRKTRLAGLLLGCLGCQLGDGSVCRGVRSGGVCCLSCGRSRGVGSDRKFGCRYGLFRQVDTSGLGLTENLGFGLLNFECFTGLCGLHLGPEQKNNTNEVSSTNT